MRPISLIAAIGALLALNQPLLFAAEPITPEPAPACADARFTKTIVLARVALPAPPPDVLNLSAALAQRLATHLRELGAFRVDLTEPTLSASMAPAADAFARLGAPYFIRLAGQDFGVSGQTSVFSMVSPSINPRGGSLTLSIDAGMTAEPVLSATVRAHPVDGVLFTPPIDAQGAAFWQTPYGQSLDALTEQAATLIANTLRCTPLIGSVLAVDGTTLTINRGSEDGLRFSDTVRILKRSDPINGLGQPMLPERFTFFHAADASIKELRPHSARVQIQGNGSAQAGDVVWVGQ